MVTSTRFSGPGPGDVVTAATRRYLAGEPIDMSVLAAELGVGRATLYRWVGSREQLLGVVLADMTERTYRIAVQGVGGTGLDRILAILDRFMHLVLDAAPLKAFTAREPRTFVRLAAAPGSIEERATKVMAELLEEEAGRGALELTLPAQTLAQAIVRIADSFMYAHFLGAPRPEVDSALQIIAMLLRRPSA